MASKADQIRERINVTTDQVVQLNAQLKKGFETLSDRDSLWVDCSGSSVSIQTSGYASMTYNEARKMARWILDMLEDYGESDG